MELVTFSGVGSYCAWPMEAYRPNDLPAAWHEDVRQRFYRDARRDGLGEEAAEEAASAFYAHWLGRNWGKRHIPRGDHARAYYSVRAYALKSAWHGFTGERRQARGKRVPRGSDGQKLKISVKKVCAGEIAARERIRAKANPTPESVAMAVERIGKTPKHAGKAHRLAKSLGLPGVRELVREACGFDAH